MGCSARPRALLAATPLVCGGASPGADVGESRRRSGRGVPSPGADVATLCVWQYVEKNESRAFELYSQVSRHICTGAALSPATAQGRSLSPAHICSLGSPLPHLHRDWAGVCHICTGTTSPSPATSAPGLSAPGSVPHALRPLRTGRAEVGAGLRWAGQAATMGEPSAFHGLAIMHVSRRLPACHATASARRACRRARAPCSDPTPPVQNGRLCAHSATVEARRGCTSAGNCDATVPQCRSALS
jgi:hypothetical protein